MTGIFGHSNADRQLVNTRGYRKTVVKVHGTWCTKNDTHALFPVDARSDKVTVQKNHWSDKCKIYVSISDTVVRDYSIDMMPQDPSNLESVSSQ